MRIVHINYYVLLATPDCVILVLLSCEEEIGTKRCFIVSHMPIFACVQLYNFKESKEQ